MTRITIKGMTEKEVAEAMANYTEADYLAEVEAEALEEARWAEEETEVIDFYFDKERRTWVIIDA